MSTHWASDWEGVPAVLARLFKVLLAASLLRLEVCGSGWIACSWSNDDSITHRKRPKARRFWGRAGFEEAKEVSRKLPAGGSNADC